MLADPPFNYLDTLAEVDTAIDSNAELARSIVKHGLQSFLGDDRAKEGEYQTVPAPWAGVARHGDIDKARSTLRQFYRDWSAEGAAEREACYGPVSAIWEHRSIGTNVLYGLLEQLLTRLI